MEGWRLPKPAKFRTHITTIRTCAPGTIRSARSLSLSSSSKVTEPISAQPQQRFSGMALPVAEFLANNVLCLLDNHKDDSKQIPPVPLVTGSRTYPTSWAGL
ncbi:hypothetical protein BD310DRAFT_979730 [Dichomitus squalens]|uniref:Uncharacterized protein n=1 Tax=Dichomitus squalens TaxID=114155 RepID=A0A4Q9PM57_9APHY|nr:hypothetical protein BD310DRAFT_979730 [Dichomitus squalens]